ncbi:hypothetical protein BKA70DRAFT_1398295 [Coprinopsis sp. MPI-PUGE-AT-0042]|nr:hypothetical protein BKA70DRAFT_1398295 [Coprinopsis sp. MPI-PUGE-AT-0042]
MDSLQSLSCIPERPPGLSYYLFSNEFPSNRELLTLDAYLAKLRKCLENLESDGDIGELLVEDDTEVTQRSRIQCEYDLFASFKSPIRKIPPEILGIIFVFAVGASPFNRFIDVVHLRGVCSSWRRAALLTSGIWTDLTVDLDKWCTVETGNLDDEMLLRQFADELDPWMAIVTRKPPYHLTLTSSDNSAPISSTIEDNQIRLVQHLLSTTPQPGTITVKSMVGALGIASLASMGLTCPSLMLRLFGDWTADLHAIGSVFPSLEALEVRILVTLDVIPPFHHASLQTLALHNLTGQEIYLEHFLREMPCLRELNLSSRQFIVKGNVNVVTTAYTHAFLKTLIIDGEDFFFALRHISLPSLRFLSIHGIEFMADDDEVSPTNIFTRTFQQRTTQPLLVMLHGCLYQSFLSRPIQSLPPNCHLLLDFASEEDEGPELALSIASDNIETIVCRRDAVDLRWLSSASPARKESSRPLTIYLPTGFEGWEKGYSRQGELRRHGFELEPRSNESVGSMLRSLAPQFSKYSAGWLECELIVHFSRCTASRSRW